jgi:hypothetical protein
LYIYIYIYIYTYIYIKFPFKNIIIIIIFCGKEFQSLGCHSWPCKSKVGNERESTLNVNPAMEMPTQMRQPVKSYKTVKCCYGKVCKLGARGLKMHQRSKL